jgi:hypothetical protein
MIDEEFQRNRESALRCLEDPKFNVAKARFEQAFERLQEIPPATRDAIGDIYDALESVFKVVTRAPPSGTINSNGLRAGIGPLIEAKYKDAQVKDTSHKMLRSLGAWIPGVHNYRHGQTDGLPNPPLEVAVHILATGAAHLRWMAALADA